MIKFAFSFFCEYGRKEIGHCVCDQFFGGMDCSEGISKTKRTE